MALEGCRVLLLRDGGGAVAVSPGAVVALGAELSVHGEPPLAANTLTHIVARGGWPAVVAAAPSLARRFDPAQPDGPPRQAQLPQFVSTTWLEDCVRTGRRAAEQPHVFELGPQRGARRPRSQEGAAAQQGDDDGNGDGERPRQLRRTASGQEGQPIDLADSQGSQCGAPDEPAPPPPPPQYRQQRDDEEEEAECVKLLVKLFETATVGAEPRYAGDTDGAQRCIKAAAKFLQNEAGGASKRKSLNCEKTERYLCGCDKREGGGGCGGPHAPHGVLTMRLLTLVGFRVIRSGSGESSVRHLACPAADGRANLRHGVLSRLGQMKATIDQEIAAEHARRKGEVEKLLEAMREAAAFRSGLSESSVAASNEAASSDKKKAAGVRPMIPVASGLHSSQDASDIVVTGRAG